MKSDHVNKIYVFTAGLCAGIVLYIWYIHKRSSIKDTCRPTVQNKKHENNFLKISESLESTDEGSRQDQDCFVTSPVFKYVHKLSYGNSIGTDDADVKLLAINPYGEAIREVIKQEVQTPEPLPFESLEVVKSLFDDIYFKPLQSFINDNHNLLDNISSISNSFNLRGSTQSEPKLPTASTWKELLPPGEASNINKSNQCKNSASAPVTKETDFKKFADKHLRLPSTLFITPYPLHMVYRKLKYLKQSDFGYCHSVILTEKSASRRFEIWRIDNKKQSYMDWNSIYNCDYLDEPNMPIKFKEILALMMADYINDESWMTNYYMPTAEKYEEIITVEELNCFKVFIKPLLYDINSRVSCILNEYYKINQKTPMNYIYLL
ncbi:hypothetical protein SNE40_012580 [Patella caerulea]|uniref:Uncharacterized protein n=1 Tax=Patella caerulea TaxID=87958 RepID=A0AAN8Q1M4_PATCE